MYKIDALLKQPQKTFHTSDLGVIWGISNANTLYTTIKRYVQKGVLIKIHKGFYSVVPASELDPLQLGISFLHRYAYVSTETVLSQGGIINQVIYPITLISSVSLKFTLNGQDYICRKLKLDRLFDSTGIEEQNGILMANTKRAVADMLYFNPKYHFDNLSKNI